VLGLPPFIFREKKRAARVFSELSGPRGTSDCAFYQFGRSGLDRGSGFSAFGFVDSFLGSAPACACETRSIRVPLSRCTFFPAEVINEPDVLFTAVELKLNPFNPKTP
jgi:hypothetical protein